MNYNWLAREIFLKKVETLSLVVLDDLRGMTSMVQHLKIPEDYTISHYLEDIKLEERKHTFVGP